MTLADGHASPLLFPLFANLASIFLAAMVESLHIRIFRRVYATVLLLYILVLLFSFKLWFPNDSRYIGYADMAPTEEIVTRIIVFSIPAISLFLWFLLSLMDKKKLSKNDGHE